MKKNELLFALQKADFDFVAFVHFGTEESHYAVYEDLTFGDDSIHLATGAFALAGQIFVYAHGENWRAVGGGGAVVGTAIGGASAMPVIFVIIHWSIHPHRLSVSAYQSELFGPRERFHFGLGYRGA